MTPPAPAVILHIDAAVKLTRRQQPQMMVREDLRRFKQLLEAGEIPTTEGQPSGRRNILTRPFRPRTDSEMLRSQPYES